MPQNSAAGVGVRNAAASRGVAPTAARPLHKIPHAVATKNPARKPAEPVEIHSKQMERPRITNTKLSAFVWPRLGWDAGKTRVTQNASMILTLSTGWHDESCGGNQNARRSRSQTKKHLPAFESTRAAHLGVEDLLHFADLRQVHYH